jgi:hypothetical protein
MDLITENRARGNSIRSPSCLRCWDLTRSSSRNATESVSRQPIRDTQTPGLKGLTKVSHTRSVESGFLMNTTALKSSGETFANLAYSVMLKECKTVLVFLVCMYVCMYECVCVCVYFSVYLSLYMYVCVCVRLCVFVYVHVRMTQACIYARKHVGTHAPTEECIRACTYDVCTYVRVYALCIYFFVHPECSCRVTVHFSQTLATTWTTALRCT